VLQYEQILKYLFSSAGVVDEDYRGNIGVVLFNHSDKPFNISHGDRIAQLICEKIYYPELQEVKVSIMQFCVLF
jgi:dUTPase